MMSTPIARVAYTMMMQADLVYRLRGLSEYHSSIARPLVFGNIIQRIREESALRQMGRSPVGQFQSEIHDTSFCVALFGRLFVEKQARLCKDLDGN